MNPKCPWCGGKIVVYKNGYFFMHRCEKWCYTSPASHDTKKQALAAASKRFMPKRSVEEINKYESYCSMLWVTEYKKFQADDKDIVRGYQFASYLNSIHETRIADFIYGVSE